MFQEMDAAFNRIFTAMSRDFDIPDPLQTEYHVTFAGSGFLDDSPPSQVNHGFSGPEDIELEVQRYDGNVVVIAELHGITESNLNLAVRGQQLIIDASGDDRVKHAVTTLPDDVDKASMKYTLKNGVLEVTFTVLSEVS
jgi:HSP20 family molecular chaperone IbpA